MIDINELRRLAQAATPGPDGVSLNWLKLLQDFQKEANPAVINELLDRLEAAEKDIALKERIIDSLGSELNAVANERDDLLARIREMERQEPVAWLHETRRDSDVVTNAVKHVWGKAVVGALAAYSIPLYLAPGAQPAPSEKDEPIRKAWARFSNALHRSPDAPYPGMSEAFEKHFSQSFTDREWRAESGTWAAAWKAAKNHGAQPTLRAPPDAIDAINRARETAMKHALAARIPECGVFAEIAQDLDYAQSKLVPEAKP